MIETNGAAPEARADDYQIASQNYAVARERLTVIDARIAEIKAGTVDDVLDTAAAAYLADPLQAGSFQPELDRLGAEREVVERAVGIARGKFDAARSVRNNDVVKSLRPGHREAAARVAACLVELAAANADELRIRQRAPGGALSFCSFPGVDLGRQDTQAKHFLAYLKRVYAIMPAPRTEAAE